MATRLSDRVRDTGLNKLQVELGLLLIVTALAIHTIAQSPFAIHIAIIPSPYLTYGVIAALGLMGTGLVLFSALKWTRRLSDLNRAAKQALRRLEFIDAARDALADVRDGRCARMQIALSRHLGCTVSGWIEFDHNGDAVKLESYREEQLIPVAELAIHHLLLDAGQLVFLPQGIGNSRYPAMLLPLVRRRRGLVAALITWPQRELPGDEKLSLAQSLVDVAMAAAIGAEQLPATPRQHVFAELRRRLVNADNLAAAMPLIYDSLQEVVDFDLLRIAVFEPRGFQVTQHCIGRGRNLLSERERQISTKFTRLAALFQRPELDFVAQLADSPCEDDRWLRNCGAVCAMTIPLVVQNQVVAAVTLAASTPSLSRETGEALAQEISTTLLPLIRIDALEHGMIAVNRQILDLTAALKSAMSDAAPDTQLHDLLKTTVTKLPSTYCRLWRFDARRNMLELLGEASARDVSGRATANPSVALSDAPWHEQAIRNRHLVVINQREERTRVTDAEISRTLLAGLSSALLIPLVSGDRVLGMLDIVELRSWERNHFSLGETLFARGVAAIITQVLDRTSRTASNLRLQQRVDRLEQRQIFSDLFAELPQRVATPLTAIMARTNHLLATIAVRDEDASRNLVAIKRHAERIVDSIRLLQNTRREEMTAPPKTEDRILVG